MERIGVQMMRQWIRKGVPLGVIAVIALTLKWHYSIAPAGQLRWILAPTAACVGLMNGRSFTYENGAGYCDYVHRSVIAPVCAGVNFMIVAFCMIAVMAVVRSDRWKVRLLSIAVSLVVAWVVTVVINAVRITFALYCSDSGLHIGWLTPDRVHRLAGIAVYFTALCGIHAAVGRCLRRLAGGSRACMHEVPIDKKSISSVFVPVLWYFAMTLAVPLLLGKYPRYGSQLFEHALCVLLVPGMALSVVFLIRRNRSSAGGALQ